MKVHNPIIQNSKFEIKRQTRCCVVSFCVKHFVIGFFVPISAKNKSQAHVFYIISRIFFGSHKVHSYTIHSVYALSLSVSLSFCVYIFHSLLYCSTLFFSAFVC